MKKSLDGNSPIFLQVKEAIEGEILTGRLLPEGQIPSNRQLVALWGVNPVTVLKGIDLLVAEGVLYKKRGMGMFVSPGAPEILKKRIGGGFKEGQLGPLVKTAAGLGITIGRLHQLIDEAWEENGYN